MKRDDRLRMLSWDHHHGLVMSLRIERELPNATPEALSRLYSDLIAFWSAGLLPHFRTENECLLARLVRHLPPEHETVRKTQLDHLSLEALVATMRDADSDDVRRTTLAEFGATLKAHIRWEESVLFESTQQRLTEPEMDALGEDINERHPEVVPAPGEPR
jgi:O-methyltransferase involved in polyketide biosynthesis